MGLLGNGYRHSLTGSLFGATALDGANPSVLRSFGNFAASRRNSLVSDAAINPQASVPSGARHPYVFMAPRVGGSIKSFRRAGIAVNGAASGELGYPATGTTSITLDGLAVAGLIVGATGTATISINGQAAILATLASTGTATITVNANAVIGAVASLTGTGVVSVTGSGDIMGEGVMTGTTIESGLTPAGIARAVWDSVLLQHQKEGTAGKSLSAAGSGGVDYAALGEAVWAHTSRTLTSSGSSAPTTAEIVAAIEAAVVSVNVKKVNNVTIKGAGAVGNEWGPA